MNIYMYIPDSNDNEPIGTSNQVIYRNIKNYKRTLFYKHCKNNNIKIKVFSFYNFYDNNTFKLIERT